MKGREIMTSYGVFIDYTFVLLATVIMIYLVVMFGYRRGMRGIRYWTLAVLEVTFAFILWQILFFVLRILAYTGGTIEEIFLKDAISNIVAYLIALGLLLYVEKQRTTSLMR